MKRRNFVKLAGGACASALLGGDLARAQGGGRQTAGEGAFLDRRTLQTRNQNRSTAVCANAMLCLVEPMMCGPGGDLFAIVWSPAV